MAFAWTDEHVERMKTLWGLGRSASEIAADLGAGVTRNAVIGKLHRLGLMRKRGDAAAVSRAKPIQTKAKPAPKPKPVAVTLAKAPLPIAKPVVVTPDAPTGPGVDFWSLGPRSCRYPLGRATDRPERFCGHETPVGSAWCAYHRSIVYVPRSTAKRPVNPKADMHRFMKPAYRAEAAE